MVFNPRRLIPLLSCIACGGSRDAEPVLTDAVTKLASHAQVRESRNAAVPSVRRALLAEGFGDETEGPGEAHVPYVVGADEAPMPGPNARRLTRFVHLADLQLADDESPARMSAADQPGITDAAYRPHDAYMCRFADAMIRTTAALKPDFLLLGGDNIDNAQSNELDWLLALLGEKPSMLDCDSGDDDTQQPKTPFEAHGLGEVPWLWITGNHDLLVQGNVVVSDDGNASAVGTHADLGTRDWSKLGGPVVQGTVPADERRKLLSQPELLRRLGAGHGVAAPESGRADGTWDVPGTPLRFVLLDTAARSGGSDGVLPRSVLDDFLKPALEQAQADGKWVVVAAHHASSSLGDGDQPFGTRQADAVTGDEYVELLTRYPNVLFSLAGHSHRHRVRTLHGAGHDVVEVTTASLADFPFQSRLLELYDEDDGWLRLHATNLDVQGDEPLLAEGRRLAVLDWTTGWFSSAPTAVTDRNVDIWVKKPAALTP